MPAERLHDYEWLLFDLDNTILDFNKSSELAFLHAFDQYSVTMDATQYKRYKAINHRYWVMLEKRQITAESLKVQRWAEFIEDMQISADPKDINSIYLNHISHNPIFITNALDSLDQLKGKYKLMLITNGLTEVQVPRLELTGLANYFEHIIISEQLSHAKPSKAFFDHCYDLAGQPMKDMVLVIGDTITSDIKGGLDFGFHTCWYNYGKGKNNSEYRPTYEVKSQLALQDLLLQSI